MLVKRAPEPGGELAAFAQRHPLIRVHAVLDPSVHRVPDSQAVRAHFDARLIADDDDQVLLVAVIDDRVLGLAEVTLDPPPPAHQTCCRCRARTST